MAWKSIIMGEARGAGNTNFQFLPEGREWRGPLSAGNGTTMMLAFKEVDQLNIDLEPGAIDVVKGEQANERD
jgi:hypothetical protein